MKSPRKILTGVRGSARNIWLAFSLLYLATGSVVYAQNFDGWWVVVGATQGTLFNDRGAKLIHARIGRCGLTAFNDFSEKFTGFAPGLTVFVLGPYSSRGEAMAVQSAARHCVPDAYIKQGRYLGE